MRRVKLITLLSVTAIYFFSVFQRVAVPGTIFNELQLAFSASAAAIAALGSIYLYIYGAMQIFVGMFSDMLGSSRTLIIGGILLAAGSIFFPGGETLGQLYFARGLVGLGASLIYISMLKHVNTFFSLEMFPLVFACGLIVGYSGGLAATLNEIAHQSGVGVELVESALPIRGEVKSACELLGLDPLYVANEGKLIAICPPEDAERLLAVMRAHPKGKDSAIVGQVLDDPRCFVRMKTQLGGTRMVDWLAGEQLPRIC